MWIMIICCAVPLLLILTLGIGGKTLGAPTWIVLGGVGLMTVAHFFMMGRPHKNHDDRHEIKGEGDENKRDGSKDKNHSGHGCCH